MSMNKCKQLLAVRMLEERLKSASPDECGKLTKELVKLKDEWING